MKRKLALFMAVMMTLSLLPMNVFANTKGTLYKSVGSVPEDTVMLETSVYNGGLKQVSGNNEIDYYVGGSDLVLEVTDEVMSGEQFRVELSNADFFFRGTTTSTEALRAAGSGTRFHDLMDSLGIAAADFTLRTDQNDWTSSWVDGYINHSGSSVSLSSRNGRGYTTYDPDKGVWVPNSTYLGGTYYRYPNIVESTSREGVPYQLTIDPYSDKKAVIQILPKIAGSSKTYNYNLKENSTLSTGSFWEIRIPLVSLTDDGSDIKVRVESNTSGITSGTWLFGLTSGNATKTEVTDPQTARDDFECLDDLLISETRLGSIRSGQVYIKLPTGFEWTNLNKARVGVSSGLSWGNANDRLIRGTTSSYYNGSTSADVPSGSEYEGSYSGTAIASSAGSYYAYGTDTYWNPGSGKNTIGYGVPYGQSGTSTTTVTREITKVSVGSPTDDGLPVGTIRTVSYTSGTTFDLAAELATLGLTGAWIYTGSETSSTSTNGWDYALNYKNPGSSSEDRSTLVLTLNGIGRSENVLGAVYINGLEFYALENAAYGPVNAEITNVDSNIEVVTNQTFLAGTRVDWTISLKALGTIPELVNGRYDAEEPWNASDVHKTAKVQFKENTTAAWWSQRQTVFSLPEGVKFRKVQITYVDKMDDYEDALKNTSYTSSYYGYNPGSGIYINDAEKHGNVTVDGNQLIWNNLKVNADKKATIEFDAWVSIESGFQGDVTLSVSGSAIPEQPGTVPAVVIAKQISPISISTKITDVKIGYQYVSTASIELTETKAGILEKGKDVRVSVTDLVSTDLFFSSDTKVAVKNAGESGALKIKNVQNVTASSGTVYGLAVNGGTIKFEIDAASSKASTIVISDVAVKVDRTVPETNKYPYQVVVWGKAIANNYQYINDSEHYRYPRTSNSVNGTNYAKDLFGTAGIKADYIRIVTSANDKPNVLYAEVRVTIGEKYYTVNGKQSDMDAAAYISTASNSTMVPLRFVSNALGISNEGVIWDGDNRTVTIIAPDGKIAQFKIGDSTMTLNGTPVTMMSPDGLPVVAEIVGDRSYVPFRALGDAFAIPVTWEEDTQSAVYNKGAATGATEAAAATEAETR